MAKVLVVYYSRTGTTQKAAERLARSLDADIEPILEERDRHGLIGYLRSGYEAYFQITKPYLPPGFDPKRYELVVIATPIWNASLASPVRSYLRANRGRFAQIAALITCGGLGAERVERQIEEETGMRLRGAVALTDRDRKEKVDLSKVDDLARSLRGALVGKAAARPSAPSHA